jgi:hypothetical protein
MRDDAVVQELSRIAELGKDFIENDFWPYVKKFFQTSDKVGLQQALFSDPWDGIRFLLGCFFFARAGAERAGYNFLMVEALDGIPNASRNPSSKVIRDRVWEAFEANCHRRGIAPFEKRNKRLLMDLFTLTASKGNLMKWVQGCLKQGQLDEVFTTFTDIHGVGEKIAALAVRDLVWIFDIPESSLPADQHIFLQPIDRWVKRRALAIWPDLRDSAPSWFIANKIALVCRLNDISGIAFNQGAWYFGARLGEN